MKAYSIFSDKAKAIQVCVNRFDDETKQAFLELYDKVDADFVMPSDESIKEYIDTRAAQWYNYDKLLVLYVWWIDND